MSIVERRFKIEDDHYWLLHKHEDDSRVVINDVGDVLLKFSSSLAITDGSDRAIGALRATHSLWELQRKGKSVSCGPVRDFHWEALADAEVNAAKVIIKEMTLDHARAQFKGTNVFQAVYVDPTTLNATLTVENENVPVFHRTVNMMTGTVVDEGANVPDALRSMFERAFSADTVRRLGIQLATEMCESVSLSEQPAVVYKHPLFGSCVYKGDLQEFTVKDDDGTEHTFAR